MDGIILNVLADSGSELESDDDDDDDEASDDDANDSAEENQPTQNKEDLHTLRLTKAAVKTSPEDLQTLAKAAVETSPIAELVQNQPAENKEDLHAL